MTGFEFLPLLSFKVVVTALVVVAISAVIEHSGPVVGGVLPITAGPGYAFLALQSTPHFVAQSALFSFAIVSANMIYVAIYLLAVRHFRPFATTTICLAGWFACALVVRAAPSSLWFGLGLNSALFIASLPLIHTPAIAIAAAASNGRSPRTPAEGGRRGCARRHCRHGKRDGGQLDHRDRDAVPRYPRDDRLDHAEPLRRRASDLGHDGALIALPGFGLSIMTLYLLAERTGVPAALAICLLMSLSWAAATLWFRRMDWRWPAQNGKAA